MEKNKLIYKTIVVSEDENGKPIKTILKKRSFIPLYFLIVLTIFILCLSFVLSNYSGNVQLSELGNIVSQLFVPSKWSLKTNDAWWNYLWFTACKKIWNTIEMVFISTFIGSVFAIPFYLIASRNIVKNKVVNNLVKFIGNIIRTIPTFVYAVIGAIFYGYSETAGIFAMSVFTFSLIFKLMYEYVETCDMNPFELSLSSGANRLQSYIVSIHPQVLPMFISNVIYAFELNIRASVILGFVGAGGIGQLLSDAMESTQYDKIGAILIPLFIVILALELLSNYLREKII